MKGAGISSAYQGIEKSYTGKRIDPKEYVADVSFGAVTGVFTGGAGAIGESVAANAAKQGAKIAIRAGTGVAVGVGSKAITEVKECGTNEKKWKDFSKTLDSNGNVNNAGTAVSWASSGVVGIIGVGSSQIASKLSQGANVVKESVMRVLVSGTTAAASDAVVQGGNILAGIQEKFDAKQCVTSAAVSAVTTLGQEGVKQGIYSVKGGKDSFLTNRANDRMIEENVPDLEDQQSSKSGVNKLKQIDSETLNKEQAKAAANTRFRSKQTKNTQRKMQKTVKMTDQNIHQLEGKLLGNVAVDISPSSDGSRNQKRLIVNTENTNGDHKVIGFLPDHNYKNFSQQNGLNQHDYHMTVGDKVQNLVGFIETSQQTRQTENEENQEFQML